jgi:hypothetical protein
MECKPFFTEGSWTTSRRTHLKLFLKKTWQRLSIGWWQTSPSGFSLQAPVGIHTQSGWSPEKTSWRKKEQLLQEGHETSSSVPPLLKKTSGEREVRATNTITLRPLTNSHCSVAGDTAKNPRTSGRGKSICQAQNYHWGGTQALSYPWDPEPWAGWTLRINQKNRENFIHLPLPGWKHHITTGMAAKEPEQVEALWVIA